MRSDLIAHIDTDSLIHNLESLRAGCASDVRICAPLKADAYGHGVSIVAPALQNAGVDIAAVATVPEAVELRDVGWTGDILVLGNVLAVADDDERAERFTAVVEYQLTLTIADAQTLSRIEQFAPRHRIPTHLKIDSGMGRMGAMPNDADALAAAILDSESVSLRGIYSHFATADLALCDLAQRQIVAFERIVKTVRRRTNTPFIVHLANSAATITMPAAHFDMVRPGLALYGYAPAAAMRSKIDLRPILRLSSHFSAVKWLPPGHCVGYGQTFTTRRETRLGIIPVGYFDGFLRRLSNRGVVGTAQGRVPIVGRISMDQLAVDLTDLPNPKVGDVAILIDPDPTAENSVESLAKTLETIPYEVTCSLGRRIDRFAAPKSANFAPQSVAAAI